MGSILELLAPISMVITAVLMLVLNIMDTKKEKEEERLRAFKDKHDEIKKRWKEAEQKEI